MPLKIIPFLSQLKENNNRDWFEAHRPDFEEAKSELVLLVTGLLKELAVFEPSMALLDPKKSIFRIYRDVRFSKNKDPYKTALGAFMAVGGKSGNHAGYYIHFEPDNCFIGGGIYGPEPATLKAIRQEIYFNGAAFDQLLHQPNFVKTFGEMRDEKLKRPPKGFPADFQYIDYLLYKHFVVSTFFDVSNKEIPQIIKEAAAKFAIMADFIQFLNSAIHNAENG